MAKVLINGTVKTDNEIINFEVKGILNINSNILIYNFDDVKNILYLNENILKRESVDNIITLDFNRIDSNKSCIFLKDTNYEIELNIKPVFIDKTVNKYKVEYLLEGRQKIEYEIKYNFI